LLLLQLFRISFIRLLHQFQFSLHLLGLFLLFPHIFLSLNNLAFSIKFLPVLLIDLGLDHLSSFIRFLGFLLRLFFVLSEGFSFFEKLSAFFSILINGLREIIEFNDLTALLFPPVSILLRFNYLNGRGLDLWLFFDFRFFFVLTRDLESCWCLSFIFVTLLLDSNSDKLIGSWLFWSLRSCGSLSGFRV
jgi:hypothetical protein